MKTCFIFCAAIAQFSLLLPAGAQVTELNLARSKYTVAEPVGLVFETRLEQKNRQRFMTVICYTEGDFLVKQFNNPIVKISDVPYDKILEVRGTLREIMIVLDEYINNPGGKVEFSVGFNLWWLDQVESKRSDPPSIHKPSSSGCATSSINVDKAQKLLKSSVSGADQEKAQNTLRRAQRELEISQQELTAPIKDNEILYDHRESLQFFSVVNQCHRYRSRAGSTPRSERNQPFQPNTRCNSTCHQKTRACNIGPSKKLDGRSLKLVSVAGSLEAIAGEIWMNRQPSQSSRLL